MLNIKGIFYTILSAVIFGIMPIMAVYAYKEGAEAFTIVFLRSFWAIFILLIYLSVRNISLKISKEELKSLILLGTLGYASTTLTLFLSYNYISVGLATTLHFVYPILVAVVSVILFKDKINIVKSIALILSVIGILILKNGQGDLNIYGITLALVSGVLYSYYILGLAHSKVKNINPFVLTFYLSIVTSIFIFLVGIPTGMLTFNMNLFAWIISLLIAFFTSIVAVIAFQIGVKIIGPSTASILSTFEPVVSIILGIILLNESLNSTSLVGCAFIIISVILVTGCEKLKRAKTGII